MTAPLFLSEEAFRDYMDEMTGASWPATTADLHVAWHRENGPMGKVSCPWDACDPEADRVDPDPEPLNTHWINCGHCGRRHPSVDAVRDCALYWFSTTT